MNDSHTLIADAYRTHKTSLFHYFLKYTEDKAVAEDLTQDVFLRMLEWKQEISTLTVKNLVFRIARNLLCDYLRRLYVKRDSYSHVADSSLLYDTTTESAIIAADLYRLECRIVAGLSPRRRQAYTLSRFGGKDSSEIAELMGLSRRTAENNIFISRKIVRKLLRSCC